jgi:hypothetical protein
MKNESLKLGLTYLSGQHIYSKDPSVKVLKLVEPESEQEKTKSVLEDILRWADDGGQISEIGNAPDPSISATSEKRANG